MIEALFNGFIKIFFWLIKTVGSIILYPIQALLITVFPALGNVIGTLISFFDTYVFPTLSFFRTWVQQIACLDNTVWLIFVAFLILRWAIAPSIRTIKLVLNLFKITKGGTSK